MPSQKKSGSKITRKDLAVHHMVFQKGGLPDGTVLGYCVHKKKLLEGYKKGDGIVCGCCDSEVSASTFEAHAGFARLRKPYHHIFTSNEVSLHNFAMHLLLERKVPKEKSDLLCAKCSKGGTLISCDMCPRAFHVECISHSCVPRGKWFCNSCKAILERGKSVRRCKNAVASGRLSRVDLIRLRQITELHVNIFDYEENVTLCALCSARDHCKYCFGPRTVIICDQCQRGFHVSCFKKTKLDDLKCEPEGKWFCGKDCQSLNAFLHELLNCGEMELPESLLACLKIQEKKGPDNSRDHELKWRLLNGEIASVETAPLLSKLVAIFHECFDPIKNASGEDLIPQIVYGKDSETVSGIYCAVLMSNFVVVSTATFRVFGEVAEIPLVATPKEYQGQGYFKVLFSCLEKLLAILKVKRMVLPSAEESESIWITKFGFKVMECQEFNRLAKKYWQVMEFKKTKMLEKDVPEMNELEANPLQLTVPS